MKNWLWIQFVRQDGRRIENDKEQQKSVYRFTRANLVPNHNQKYGKNFSVRPWPKSVYDSNLKVWYDISLRSEFLL